MALPWYGVVRVSVLLESRKQQAAYTAAAALVALVCLSRLVYPKRRARPPPPRRGTDDAREFAKQHPDVRVEIIITTIMGLGRYGDVVMVLATGVLALWYRNAQVAYTVPALVFLLLCVSRLVSRKTSTGKLIPSRPMTQDKWCEQVAAVLGGCGGSGSAMCVVLLQRGCKAVYAPDLRQMRDEELRDHTGIHWIECDLSSSDAIHSAARAIPHNPTILILNAATNALTPLSDQSSTDITRTINVNLTSAMHLCNLYPHAAHTTIISSVMSIAGVKGMEMYVASKYALVGLYESLLRSRSSTSNISLILPSHISAQLFSRWEYPFPFNHLTPTLAPAYVASSCVDEAQARRTSRVYMPRLTVGMELLGFTWVPRWCKELAIWASASDQAAQEMRLQEKQQRANDELFDTVSPTVDNPPTTKGAARDAAMRAAFRRTSDVTLERASIVRPLARPSETGSAAGAASFLNSTLRRINDPIPSTMSTTSFSSAGSAVSSPHSCPASSPTPALLRAPMLSKPFKAVVNTTRSDPVDYLDDDDPVMPTAIDLERDFAVLKERTTTAILQAQRGCQLPLSLGSWSRDQYVRLAERFPRHRFTWVTGRIWFDGDPPQRAHQRMTQTLQTTVARFCQGSYSEIEPSITFNDEVSKFPDLVFPLPHPGSAPTVVEVTWAHEPIIKVEQQLHVAAASGFNAIAVKGWLNDKSGNSAAQDINLDQPYEALSNLTSILLLVKPAGSPHVSRVWRLGDKARAARLSLPSVAMPGTIAWLSRAWFGPHGTPQGTFPVSLSTIGDAIALGVMGDRQLPAPQITTFLFAAREAARNRDLASITANATLTAEEQGSLLMAANNGGY